MDLIELAERQYARMCPKPGGDWVSAPIREVLVWLKDYVCPVVEDYVNDASFRTLARWPLDVLAETELSGIAGLVGKVDRRLVDAAKALLAVADNEAIRKKIREQNPPKKKVVEEESIISAEGSVQLNAIVAEVDDLRLKLAQVQQIAEHRYAALACPDDYFRPVGSVRRPEDLAEFRKQTGRQITEGELIVNYTPELHLLGDFITRSMFRRIEVWMDVLKDYRTIVYDAVRKVRAKVSVEAESRAWENLVAAEAVLRQACLTGESTRLRDACIILTQVYATFHPKPDLEWLGLSGPVIQNGTHTIRFVIECRRGAEALDQIAGALHSLRSLQTMQGGRLEAVIQTGGLVMVRQPPAVYWEKKEIAASWDTNTKPFSLLWLLAERAKQGQRFVKDKDFWDMPGCKSRLSTTKGRLERLLGESTLLGKLETVSSKGIRLKLEGRQIHLLQTPTG